MQYKMIHVLKSLLVMLLAGVFVVACNKKFDAPPEFIEPNITANTTLKALKERHTIGNFEKIEEDLIVSGIVVADDKSGNFYKSIAIQDETGGITVRLDGTNLYTTYPVGRKLYINLKGLYLGDYNRLIQIGGGIDESDPSRPELSPIASALFDKYIIKGSLNNEVTPKVVKVSELHDSLQSTLIQLNNMEFVVADTSKTYADAAAKVTRNLNVKGCGGSSVIVRTSGYSTFAGVNVPNDNGTLLAIYTMFGSTKQLVIRDTDDVQFNQPRCGTGPATEMNIADLRALFDGNPAEAPNGRKIRGVVISDRLANNQDDNNVVIQQGDGMAGIMVRFSDPHTFDLGDVIEVNVSGQSLEEFNGLLQLNNVPKDFATKVGAGTITPRVVTAADLLANAETWESTLVQINNVTITGGNSGKWGGSTTLTDVASNSVIAFTRNGSSSASFANTAYPAFANSVVGYVSQFNTDKQLIIRNLNDVVAPPPPPTGAIDVVYDFSLVTQTSGAVDPTTPPTGPSVTFTSFRAVGLAGANSSGAGRFSFNDWPTGATNGVDAFTGTVDLNKYYEITITPAAGIKLDLTTLTFKLQRSGTGARQAVVRASVDNFASNLSASIDPANAALSVVPTNVFQVADATTTGVNGCKITFGAGFTNLTGPVTIRFYGLNAEAATGTFSIDDVNIIGATR